MSASRLYFALIVFCGQKLSEQCAALQSGLGSLPSLPDGGEHPHVKKCFHVDAEVSLANGGTIPAGHLRTGDHVLDKDGRPTLVILLLNRDPITVRRFVRVRTVKGHGLALTGEHALFVRECNQTEDDWSLRPASSVTTGQCVMLAGGRPEEVEIVEQFVDAGVVLPVTESGSLVVGGVAVSCYDTDSDKASFDSIHESYAPFRFLYNIAERIYNGMPNKRQASLVIDALIEGLGLRLMY